MKAICLKDPDTIISELPALREQTDYIIADGPGSLAEMSRALLLVADKAIVPCKASMLEVRALDAATKVLRQSQQIRSGVPKAMIVLSMVGKNYRLTQDMRDAAALLKLPIANTALTLRQIYADAPGQRRFRSRFETLLTGAAITWRGAKHLAGYSGAGHRALAQIARLHPVTYSEGAGKAGRATGSASGNSCWRAVSFK